MIFEMLDIFDFDYKIIATKFDDIDYIFEKVGEFVRTKIFPKMLELDFTEMRYMFNTHDKFVICQCFYTYKHDVLLQICLPNNSEMIVAQMADEIKNKSKTLFDSLTEEFIEYCKQNSDMDRYTKINKFIKEDKNEKID